MELIVIAAGRGSRFLKSGISHPKPLVEFLNKPLFWWAAESAQSTGEFSRIHFAILAEHVKQYSIDKKILEIYPEAILHIIDSVTAGAAATAAQIAEKIAPKMALAFVDCDVAFSFALPRNFDLVLNGDASSALCIFESTNPAYSYAQFNQNFEITSTVEKNVVSNWAICGLYAFKSAAFFLELYSSYIKNCPYQEFFISGMFNEIRDPDKLILPIKLNTHVSLGTPEDIQEASKNLSTLPSWCNH